MKSTKRRCDVCGASLSTKNYSGKRKRDLCRRCNGPVMEIMLCSKLSYEEAVERRKLKLTALKLFELFEENRLRVMNELEMCVTRT